MSEFIPFPAIDLRHGQVVRLKEGDPERQTAYSSDPAAAAERWLAAGAMWLHVVNLDGAFDESQAANREALAAILRAAGKYGAQVQFGGGLRTMDGVAQAFDLGVGRAILGTLAVEQPHVLAELVARWGKERVGVSLDARGGLVQVRGWKEGTNVLANDAAKELKQSGLEWLVFTDIARDGLQSGINLTATVDLARSSGLKVIASGGVRGREDVRAARKAGLAGIIAGRALYEGALGIKEFLSDEC
jgi:phosphoribosylformimino-5-aminoimidazole carboxamide ribotide isomerase